MPDRRHGLLRHGVALLAGAAGQSEEIRASLLPRLSLRHFLLQLPLGIRGAFEAFVFQGPVSFHFRLFYFALSDDLLCPRVEIDSADDRVVRFSSGGADVVHYQLLARGTEGAFVFLAALLSDCVSNGLQHIDCVKSITYSHLITMILQDSHFFFADF